MTAEDDPTSISIPQLIAGLTDMALMLNDYTVSIDPINGSIEVFCHKHNSTAFRFIDLSMLELVNQVMEHDTNEHS